MSGSVGSACVYHELPAVSSASNRRAPKSGLKYTQHRHPGLTHCRAALKFQNSADLAKLACAAATVNDFSTAQGVGEDAQDDADFPEDDFTDEEDEGEDEDSSLEVANEEGDTVIDADRTTWGRKALDIARKVLSEPAMEGLELYSFRAKATGNQLDIRLDKLEDQYGSPMLDEITDFSRQFAHELTAALGEEAAGAISFEVSSPGAERRVRVPKELERFRELPMSVTYALAGDASKCDTRVLQICTIDEEQAKTEWQLANVRSNRPGGKGSKLTKKQGLERFNIPFSSLQTVKLYIDI